MLLGTCRSGGCDPQNRVLVPMKRHVSGEGETPSRLPPASSILPFLLTDQVLRAPDLQDHMLCFFVYIVKKLKFPNSYFSRFSWMNLIFYRILRYTKKLFSSIGHIINLSVWNIERNFTALSNNNRSVTNTLHKYIITCASKRARFTVRIRQNVFNSFLFFTNNVINSWCFIAIYFCQNINRYLYYHGNLKITHHFIEISNVAKHII